ncbi:flagellar biosynthesis protein FlhF [Limisalsivibrio acetivorans]|uniref:flagellar biosynthesis protein FlhF n=1 Tax=Limisalsivibrio acetivorans TaxID=1304888 RepID=UPI0003B58308|nr:flagellar biosynthesis protein FlhF [Limisalsivibrio acetivorans]
MRIKKYEAYDMAEAMRMIKAELGSEAIILNTRKVVKNSGFGLFSKPVIEVTAAVDMDERIQEEKKVQRVKPKRSNEGYTPESYPSVTAGGTYNSYGRHAESSENEEREFVELNPDILRKQEEESARKASQKKEAGGDLGKLTELINTLGLNRFEGLMEDVADIKKQMLEMKSALSENIVVDLPPVLKEFYALMVKNGVDDVIAYKFLKRIEKRATAGLTRNQVRNLIVQLLADLIPLEKNYFSTLNSKVVAFVGPTGVGKTTTVAKIAAELSLKLKKRVSLITIDNFRIGAVEQLKTYAEIVDIPLQVASSPEELDEILRNSENYDYVFVDSMGRSQFDTEQIGDILSFIQSGKDISVALVLSMSSNHQEMADTFENYSKLKPEYLVFTKLDETKYFGPLINLPIRKKTPVLLLSTGQNVPDDMEVPDGRRIANAILREIPGFWSEK